MISRDDLARDRAICDAASRGPWTRCGADDDNCSCGIVWGGDPLMVASVPYHEDEVGGPIAEEPERLANWQFIVAARTRWPAALDALEEHERRVEAIEQMLTEVDELLRTEKGVYERGYRAALHMVLDVLRGGQ